MEKKIDVCAPRRALGVRALFTLIAVVHIYGENFAGLSMCNYHKKYNYAFNATWLN